MIGLVAYLALVVTLPALVLGHQGEDFPPLRWWRWARARRARARGCAGACGAERGSCGPRSVESAPRASTARTGPRVPSWAHQQPIEIEEAA